MTLTTAWLSHQNKTFWFWKMSYHKLTTAKIGKKNTKKVKSWRIPEWAQSPGQHWGHYWVLKNTPKPKPPEASEGASRLVLSQRIVGGGPLLGVWFVSAYFGFYKKKKWSQNTRSGLKGIKCIALSVTCMTICLSVGSLGCVLSSRNSWFLRNEFVPLSPRWQAWRSRQTDMRTRLSGTC